MMKRRFIRKKPARVPGTASPAARSRMDGVAGRGDHASHAYARGGEGGGEGRKGEGSTWCVRVCQRLSVAEPLVVRDCKCYCSSNRDAGWQSTCSPLPTLRCPPRQQASESPHLELFDDRAEVSNGVYRVTMPKDKRPRYGGACVPQMLPGMATRTTPGRRRLPHACTRKYGLPRVLRGVRLCGSRVCWGSQVASESTPADTHLPAPRPWRRNLLGVPAAFTFPRAVAPRPWRAWECRMARRPVASPRGPRRRRPCPRPRASTATRAPHARAPANRAAAPPRPRPSSRGTQRRRREKRAARGSVENDGERGGRAPKRTTASIEIRPVCSSNAARPRGRPALAPRSARARRPHDQCPRSPPRQHAPGRRSARSSRRRPPHTRTCPPPQRRAEEGARPATAAPPALAPGLAAAAGRGARPLSLSPI